jgi:hypothetical protein
VAHLRAGELSIQLAGANDASREVLRAALPQLERDLRDNGFASCTVNVSQDGPQSDRQHRPLWTLGTDAQSGNGHHGHDGSGHHGGHRRHDAVAAVTAAGSTAGTGHPDGRTTPTGRSLDTRV